jgi:hypothetical protein
MNYLPRAQRGKVPEGRMGIAASDEIFRLWPVPIRRCAPPSPMLRIGEGKNGRSRESPNQTTRPMRTMVTPARTLWFDGMTSTQLS